MYGLTLKNQRLAQEKAKTKRDGCYVMLGFAYRVRAGRVTHFAYDGEIIIPSGHFNVVAGKYSGGFYADIGKKALKSIGDTK